MSTSFKVMTWNVENLFSPGGDSGPRTDEAFEQKVGTLAGVIDTLAPDVLALQEIGDEAAFDALKSALGRAYPHGVLSAFPDGRGIRVGFLSKLAFERTEDVSEFPGGALNMVPALDNLARPTALQRMGRGALLVAVKPCRGVELNLMTAHLKSKLITYPRPGGRSSFSPSDEDERARGAGYALMRRMAEAVALRARANELVKGDGPGLILLGDLNDVTHAATTQLLSGPAGSEPGTRGFDAPDKGDDARLFNLAPLIPEPRRFSRVFKRVGELIDHILVSQELVPGKPRRVPVVDSHIDALGRLPSIGTDPGRRRDKPGSDHAPVTAVFEL